MTESTAKKQSNPTEPKVVFCANDPDSGITHNKPGMIAVKVHSEKNAARLIV